MKKIINRIFHKVFDPFAYRLGYEKISTQNKNPDLPMNIYGKKTLLDAFYSVLQAANFYPEHIVDVGANHGTWTREALRYFPDAVYTLIEPQAQMKASLKDILEANPKVSFYAVGAGKKAGTFNFTIVDRDDSCTFSYSAKEAEEKNYQQIKVPVVTLNKFIKERNLPVPGIIKIDAEGLDIDVLEGADIFFGKTEVFMVEAGIVNKVFSNSYLNVMNYMDEKGYRLFDITDLNRPFNPQVLWLTELVFVKKSGLLDSYKWV